MKTYYFFDEYGDCFVEKMFDTDAQTEAYAEEIDAEYFCLDEM